MFMFVCRGVGLQSSEAKICLLLVLPSSPTLRACSPAQLKITTSAPQLSENKWSFSFAPQNLWDGLFNTG